MGWVVNFLKQHYWKVARTNAYEDVMQEAHVVFLRCCKRFPKSKAYNTPQAFMALFKMAWANQFTDLANEDSRQRLCVSQNRMSREDEEVYEMEPIGETDNAGLLAIAVHQAPHEVVMVLTLLLNAPQELLELAMTSWKDSGRYGAGGSKHINKLLGLDPAVDCLQLVEDYFRA